MTESSEWVRQPILGLVPVFHADPHLGGPPLVSADGHWWWDGERWVVRHPDEPAA